jgi:hypothetical protein
MTNDKKEPQTNLIMSRFVVRLGRWLLLGAISAAVAHGCHAGDHGDADLLIRVIAGVGSE